MKKLFFFIFFLLPFAVCANQEDFRIYKKPLIPGIEIAQTDTHTELLYK